MYGILGDSHQFNPGMEIDQPESAELIPAITGMITAPRNAFDALAYLHRNLFGWVPGPGLDLNGANRLRTFVRQGSAPVVQASINQFTGTMVNGLPEFGSANAQVIGIAASGYLPVIPPLFSEGVQVSSDLVQGNMVGGISG